MFQHNFALFEFLRVRQVSGDEIPSEKAQLEQDLRYDPKDPRAVWARLLREAYDLFADSENVYVAEFGDPFHPSGTPPNPPGEGRRYYVDPARERIFITACKVDLPDQASFRTQVPAGERDRLAGIEAQLRKMAVVAKPAYPNLRMIDLPGHCPDSADMCKHIAAVLYGVGSRLDQKPELLFVLRGVDPQELVIEQGVPNVVGRAQGRRIPKGNLSEVFGIELANRPGKAVRARRPPPKKR